MVCYHVIYFQLFRCFFIYVLMFFLFFFTNVRHWPSESDTFFFLANCLFNRQVWFCSFCPLFKGPCFMIIHYLLFNYLAPWHEQGRFLIMCEWLNMWLYRACVLSVTTLCYCKLTKRFRMEIVTAANSLVFTIFLMFGNAVDMPQ